MQIRHDEIHKAELQKDGDNYLYNYPVTSLPYNFFNDKPPSTILVVDPANEIVSSFDFLYTSSTNMIPLWEYVWAIESKSINKKLVIKFVDDLVKRRYLFIYDVHDDYGNFKGVSTLQYIGNLDENYKQLLDSYIKSKRRNIFNVRVVDLPIGELTVDEKRQLKRYGHIKVWPYDIESYYNDMMAQLNYK